MDFKNFAYTATVVGGAISFAFGCGDRNQESHPLAAKESPSNGYELPYGPNASFLERYLKVSGLARSIQDTLDAVVEIDINGKRFLFSKDLPNGTAIPETLRINLPDPYI